MFVHKRKQFSFHFFRPARRLRLSEAIAVLVSETFHIFLIPSLETEGRFQATENRGRLCRTISGPKKDFRWFFGSG